MSGKARIVNHVPDPHSELFHNHLRLKGYKQLQLSSLGLVDHVVKSLNSINGCMAELYQELSSR